MMKRLEMELMGNTDRLSKQVGGTRKTGIRNGEKVRGDRVD